MSGLPCRGGAVFVIFAKMKGPAEWYCADSKTSSAEEKAAITVNYYLLLRMRGCSQAWRASARLERASSKVLLLASPSGSADSFLTSL
jgi:hypothetical protein